MTVSTSTMMSKSTHYFSIWMSSKNLAWCVRSCAKTTYRGSVKNSILKKMMEYKSAVIRHDWNNSAHNSEDDRVDWSPWLELHHMHTKY